MGRILRFPEPTPVGWRRLIPVFRKTLLSTLATIAILPFMMVFVVILITACVSALLLLAVNFHLLMRALRDWGKSGWDGDDDDDDDGEPVPVPEEERRLAA